MLLCVTLRQAVHASKLGREPQPESTIGRPGRRGMLKERAAPQDPRSRGEGPSQVYWCHLSDPRQDQANYPPPIGTRPFACNIPSVDKHDLSVSLYLAVLRDLPII